MRLCWGRGARCLFCFRWPCPRVQAPVRPSVTRESMRRAVGLWVHWDPGPFLGAQGALQGSRGLAQGHFCPADLGAGEPRQQTCPTWGSGPGRLPFPVFPLPGGAWLEGTGHWPCTRGWEQGRLRAGVGLLWPWGLLWSSDSFHFAPCVLPARGEHRGSEPATGSAPALPAPLTWPL